MMYASYLKALADRPIERRESRRLCRVGAKFTNLGSAQVVTYASTQESLETDSKFDACEVEEIGAR